MITDKPPLVKNLLFFNPPAGGKNQNTTFVLAKVFKVSLKTLRAFYRYAFGGKSVAKPPGGFSIFTASPVKADNCLRNSSYKLLKQSSPLVVSLTFINQAAENARTQFNIPALQ
jgi:hypothetical protein